MTTALVLLAVAGVGAAFVSDWFITALSPTMDQLGIPKAFAGLVIVAIAGNAVENVTGIVLALKGRIRPRDLGRQELGRADHRVPLPRARARVAPLHDARSPSQLDPVFIGALLLTSLALWFITSDGEATLVRGRGADLDLRDPRGRHLVRVTVAAHGLRR